MQYQAIHVAPRSDNCRTTASLHHGWLAALRWEQWRLPWPWAWNTVVLQPWSSLKVLNACVQCYTCFQELERHVEMHGEDPKPHRTGVLVPPRPTLLEEFADHLPLTVRMGEYGRQIRLSQ